MFDDTQVQLFDVALMAGELRQKKPSMFVQAGIHPFCPMLMRGWACLKSMQARIPAPVRKAAQYLKPALWSTFDQRGMDILFEAVARRKLT